MVMDYMNPWGTRRNARPKLCKALLLIATIQACWVAQESFANADPKDSNELMMPLKATSNGAAVPGSTTKDSAVLMQFPLIPHHVKFPNSSFPVEEHVRNRYRRYLQSNKTYTDGIEPVQMGALYQGFGTHYVDLWVGTPNPQRQTLIVNTGSGVTAFPCSSCLSDCGEGHHIDKVFREDKSETFQKIPCDHCQARGRCPASSGDTSDGCRVSMAYAEGSSWSAYEAIDKVYSGGPHGHALMKDDGGKGDIDPLHAKSFSFDMMFGCQTRLTGLFKTQWADGILGMSNAPTSFWRQMHREKIIPHENFSICYTRQSHVKRDGTTAGALTMGGTDKRLHMSPMVFTEAGSKELGGMFNVHIRRVYLRDSAGGESALATNSKAKLIPLTGASEADLNRGHVVIESGTTDTYFPRILAEEFKRAYMDITGQAYNHFPLQLKPSEISKLPTILIQLAGDEELNKRLYPNNPSKIAGLAGDLDPDHPYDVIVAVPPSHYMGYEERRDAYVARFYMDSRRGATIGSNTIMGHDVYFDGETNQIGLAESTCDYLELVKETTGGNDVATKAPTIIHPLMPEMHSYTTATSTTIPSTPTPKPAKSGRLAAASVTAVVITALVVGAILGRNRFSAPQYHYTHTPLPTSGDDLELHNNLQYQRCPDGTSNDNDAIL